MKYYDFSGAARYLKISKSAVTQHVGKGHIETEYQAHMGQAGKRMISEVALLTFIYSDYYVGVKKNYPKAEVQDDDDN